MVWATTITDETTKEGAIGEAYRAWKKQDAKLADEALKSAGLPEEKVQQIQNSAASPSTIKVAPN